MAATCPRGFCLEFILDGRGPLPAHPALPPSITGFDEEYKRLGTSVTGLGTLRCLQSFHLGSVMATLACQNSPAHIEAGTFV